MPLQSTLNCLVCEWYCIRVPQQQGRGAAPALESFSAGPPVETKWADVITYHFSTALCFVFNFPGNGNLGITYHKANSFHFTLKHSNNRFYLSVNMTMKSLYCYMSRMSQTFFFFLLLLNKGPQPVKIMVSDTKKKKDLFVCTLLYRSHSGTLSWTQTLCTCIIL